MLHRQTLALINNNYPARYYIHSITIILSRPVFSRR